MVDGRAVGGGGIGIGAIDGGVSVIGDDVLSHYGCGGGVVYAACPSDGRALGVGVELRESGGYVWRRRGVLVAGVRKEGRRAGGHEANRGDMVDTRLICEVGLECLLLGMLW